MILIFYLIGNISIGVYIEIFCFNLEVIFIIFKVNINFWRFWGFIIIGNFDLLVFREYYMCVLYIVEECKRYFDIV